MRKLMSCLAVFAGVSVASMAVAPRVSIAACALSQHGDVTCDSAGYNKDQTIALPHVERPSAVKEIVPIKPRKRFKNHAPASVALPLLPNPEDKYGKIPPAKLVVEPKKP